MATIMGMMGWGAICDGCGQQTPALFRTSPTAVRLAKSQMKWRTRKGKLLCLVCQKKKSEAAR